MFPHNEPCLVTIPQHNNANNGKNKEDEPSVLVLLQLPGGKSNAELIASFRPKKTNTENATIVAPSPQDQACIVLNDIGKSFSLSRVETSNALVLIQSPTPSSSSSSSSIIRPRKKIRMTTSSSFSSSSSCSHEEMVKVSAKLMPSYFLEMKEHIVDVKKLWSILKQHEYNPYDKTSMRGHIGGGGGKSPWKGRTISSLATELQVSEKQIKTVLSTQFCNNNKINNSSMNNEASLIICLNDYQSIGILAEEALFEIHKAIVATLMEDDDTNSKSNGNAKASDNDSDSFDDYAVEGVVLSTMVPQVYDRMDFDDDDTNEEEEQKRMKDIIRQCLEGMTKRMNGTKHVLDFQKIARCVARELFCRQKGWEKEELLREWQARVPGIVTNNNNKGDYIVSTTMLVGIAARTVEPKPKRQKQDHNHEDSSNNNKKSRRNNVWLAV